MTYWTARLFSELNKVFFGYFDPDFLKLDNENKYFWGELTEVSAKYEALVLNAIHWLQLPRPVQKQQTLKSVDDVDSASSSSEIVTDQLQGGAGSSRKRFDADSAATSAVLEADRSLDERASKSSIPARELFRHAPQCSLF